MTTSLLTGLADSPSNPTTLPIALGLLAAGASGLLLVLRKVDRWLREDAAEDELRSAGTHPAVFTGLDEREGVR